MLIAGPCLMNEGDEAITIRTAEKLKGKIDYFRTKLWGGGTRVDRWFPGIGHKGADTLASLGIPALTEAQSPWHVEVAAPLAGVWVGARNSQNYALIEAACQHGGQVFIKRNPGMSIDELVNLDDVIQKKFGCTVSWIERGVNTPDKTHGRWSPCLKIAYVLKQYHTDLFDRLVVDCSHSASERAFIPDVYNAFRAVGVEHFMFEVLDGESKTDTAQVLTVEQFYEVIE